MDLLMRFRYSCLTMASLTSLSICFITFTQLGFGNNRMFYRLGFVLPNAEVERQDHYAGISYLILEQSKCWPDVCVGG